MQQHHTEQINGQFTLGNKTESDKICQLRLCQKFMFKLVRCVRAGEKVDYDYSERFCCQLAPSTVWRLWSRIVYRRFPFHNY